MDTADFEPAITHIPDNFVLAKPHMVVADEDPSSSGDVETVLIRLPAGVSLAALDGVEFDWPPTDGTVVDIAASESAAPKSSKKSKKSSAVTKADKPQLVFDREMAPEASNMMVLVADSKKDSSSFRAHPITHVAAIAVPTSVPTATIRDQGQRIRDQPYVPRAQPDMPYRTAFDAFASHAVPLDDMVVDAPAPAVPKKRSAPADDEPVQEAEEATKSKKKAKRSKTEAEAPVAEAAEEKEGGKKKRKKDKKKAKAE